jgi:protein involved in sex pheromone biosynthesis
MPNRPITGALEEVVIFIYFKNNGHYLTVKTFAGLANEFINQYRKFIRFYMTPPEYRDKDEAPPFYLYHFLEGDFEVPEGTERPISCTVMLSEICSIQYFTVKELDGKNKGNEK